MKKRLISMTARSAVIIGFIFFWGRNKIDVEHMFTAIIIIGLYQTVKIAFVYRCFKEELYQSMMPIKLRYKCKEDAEAVAKKLLIGVERGDVECYFCADYSQLSGYMVLKANNVDLFDKVNMVNRISKTDEIPSVDKNPLSDKIPSSDKILSVDTIPSADKNPLSDRILSSDKIRPVDKIPSVDLDINPQHVINMEGTVCQERFETSIVSLSKGGSVLEINIPAQKRTDLNINGMDVFIKDVFEAERI